MAQQIIEGTPKELAHYFAQYPNRRFRVIEIPEEAVKTAAPILDEKAKAAIALLDAWIAEGKNAGEDARQTAEREVEEFKRNMNANRAATGERLVYP